MLEQVSRDEDVLVIPESWRGVLHPRRGGVPGPPVMPERSAATRLAEQVERARDRLTGMLAANRTQRTVARAMRAYLEGEADPRGAAAVASLVAHLTGRDAETMAETIVDAWVTDQGMAFAACALAEMSAMALVTNASTVVGVRSLPPGQPPSTWWRRGAVRLRALIAAAGDDDHRETVHRLAGHRDGEVRRSLVAYLVPTRREWVEEAVQAPPRSTALRWTLWCSVGDPGQLDLLRRSWDLGREDLRPDILMTMAEGVGAALAPMLLRELANAYRLEEAQRALLWEILAVLPGDAALDELIERVRDGRVSPLIGTALDRFPRRAARLLAARAGTDELIDELLAGHLRTHPELAGLDLPDEVVRTVVKSLQRVPDAPSGDLPLLLAEPPWTRGRTTRKPVVIKGLAAPAVRSVAWAPGEREDWLAAFPEGDHDQWARVREDPEAVAGFKDPEAASLLARGLLARFESDAVPVVLRLTRRCPITCGKLLVPFLDAQVAAYMADRFARTTAARRIAQGWLVRHGTVAVPLLVPDALGEAGPRRRNAEAVLRHLASRHGRREVAEAARACGEDAASAIDAMLATDPLDVLPGRVPKVGGWADPARLPQVLLRGGERALPASAVRHFITMLAMSKPGEVYPGVQTVRDLCDPVSLGEFGWSLFRRWRIDGAGAKNGWALHQLAWTGDDHTVRALAGVVKEWVKQGEPRLVHKGLDTLVAFESDVALMHLHWIAEEGSRRSVRAQAGQRIDALAGNLGLTPDQLADRVVPDFGLDAEGSMLLDYGRRRFTVGFDEQLRPFVIEPGGRHRTLAPRPVKTDDQRQAAAAYQRYSALRKEVGKIAAGQIERLEAAMLERRTWEPEEFRTYLVRHPLLWHIVRRLVWLCDGEAFRLAEDRTYADVNDDTLTPSPDSRIRIAHPADLGDRLRMWTDIFEDYEITQPFDQLAHDDERPKEQRHE
ncbi:DUF4132 domain-containing protein [Spirillospora sp. CA-255316]